MVKHDESEKLLVSELVKSSQKNGKIDSFEIVGIEKLTGDASARRYYRVNGNDIKYVVCLDNPKADGEVSPFYEVHGFLLEKKIRAPHIFDLHIDGSYFLEEDLGDHTLLGTLSQIESLEEEMNWYRKAVDIMLEMHKVKLSDMKKYSFYKLSFDEAKLFQEYNFTLDYFIQFFLGHSLSMKEREILDVQFKEIVREIARRPMVFTHRDYHSRNLMVKKEELVVIDFQDARLGIPQYDLVSLLEDCYYEIDPANKEELIKYYIKNFGIENQKDFYYLYDLTTLQRVFKAIGSFGFIYSKKNDKRYLKYIQFGMEKIKKIMLKYPDLSDLRKTLFKIYYAS